MSNPNPIIPNDHTYYRTYDIMAVTCGVYNWFSEKVPDTVHPIVDMMTEEQAMELVRVERNRRLFDSDWTQLPDTPLTAEEIEEWRVYRQELRDFPDILVWNESQWPVAP
jgi:hypothetical protein